jgi:uncharacterized OsmC-like protein
MSNNQHLVVAFKRTVRIKTRAINNHTNTPKQRKACLSLKLASIASCAAYKLGHACEQMVVQVEKPFVEAGVRKVETVHVKLVYTRESF